MFKPNLIKLTYVYSILLLIFASLILAFLLSFNPYSHHLNSTGFVVNSNFNNLKNTLIDFLFQQLGISLYIVPLTFLIWSYKLFFNKPTRYLLIKLFLLLFLLVITPVVLFKNNPLYMGILGNYLNLILSNISYYNYYLIIIFVGLILFISSFTLKEFYTCIQVVFYIISLIVRAINKGYNNVKNIFYQYWQNISNNKNIYNNKNNLSAAFASLNREIWENNLLNSKKKQNNYNEFNPIKEENSVLYTKNVDNNYIKHPNLSNKDNKNSLEENKSTPVDFSINFNNNHIHNTVAKCTNNSYYISTELLDAKDERNTITTQEIKTIALKLENVIKEFGIEGKIVNIQTGPVVTLYEIKIPPGVKTSKLINLETDIALRLKAYSVRIAIIPGKDVIGIEIPNHKRKTVYLRKLLEHKLFKNSDANLPINLGLDISGRPVVADLSTMPHLLVAGTTGSGKSVAVNAMILSLLYKHSPKHCKMIMIDPKMLELSTYQDIPHLLTPVVTDPQKAIFALKWAVKQMEHRYTLMSYLGVRNISGYNLKINDSSYIATVKANILEKEGFETEFPFMPYIIVIIDEMADLMLVAGKEIEAAVQRLAQMARAAGIHLIMATQRPSVDVITGTIKANFPTRISFQVSSRIDSATILGDKGAEQLLGKGDMLYMMGVGRLLRVHAPFVSDRDVDRVVSLLKTIDTPEYVNDITKDNEISNTQDNDNGLDDLYNQVIDLIKKEQKISTSYVQRKFQIGYNRAARIVESLEENGVISKASATGKREILINL